MLDLTHLEKALRQFKKTLLFCEAKADKDKQIMLQTAAIQCFEYTYELAIKMLRKSLEERLPSRNALNSISFCSFPSSAWECVPVKLPLDECQAELGWLAFPSRTWERAKIPPFEKGG